jgi:hypothetical protein
MDSMMRQRPQETLRQLSDLLPGFKEWWKAENSPAEDGLVDGVYYVWTHHAVMRQFLGFFAQHHSSFTDAQLRGVGEWINRAVAERDDVENALATCFLEHMRQVRIDHVLVPYLSRTAKERARA